MSSSYSVKVDGRPATTLAVEVALESSSSSQEDMGRPGPRTFMTNNQFSPSNIPSKDPAGRNPAFGGGAGQNWNDASRIGSDSINRPRNSSGDRGDPHNSSQQNGSWQLNSSTFPRSSHQKDFATGNRSPTDFPPPPSPPLLAPPPVAGQPMTRLRGLHYNVVRHQTDGPTEAERKLAELTRQLENEMRLTGSRSHDSFSGGAISAGATAERPSVKATYPDVATSEQWPPSPSMASRLSPRQPEGIGSQRAPSQKDEPYFGELINVM